MEMKNSRRKIIDSRLVPPNRRKTRLPVNVFGINVQTEEYGDIGAATVYAYNVSCDVKKMDNSEMKNNTTDNTAVHNQDTEPLGTVSRQGSVARAVVAEIMEDLIERTIDVVETLLDKEHLLSKEANSSVNKFSVESTKDSSSTEENVHLETAPHEYKTVILIKNDTPQAKSVTNVLDDNYSESSEIQNCSCENASRDTSAELQDLHRHQKLFYPSLTTILELDSVDPHRVELGHVTRGLSDGPEVFGETIAGESSSTCRNLVADMYREFTTRKESLDIDEADLRALGEDDDRGEAYSAMMEGGAPRLLTVEEKWQIIFNEKTRAPIYAVGQYIEYLDQFVNGRSTASRDKDNLIKREGINPISYLLRKLKLDLKMSYDSFLEEFLKPGNSGMSYLVKLLKSIQDTGSQQSGSTNMAQLKNYKKTLTDEHDCLLCIKYALRLKSAVTMLVDITYGVETVAMSLLSTFTKSRGTAIEILTVALCTKEGFSRILDCFAFVRLKVGESVRFKSLMNMLNMGGDQNAVFKVCTMKFLNCLLDAATNLNIRVFLQYELESAGLDVNQLIESTTGNGLEYDDLRFELELWKRKYINVEALVSQTGNTSRREDNSHQKTVDDLKHKVRVLSHEKSQLEQKLKAVRSELKICFEEVQKHNVMTHNVSVQCGTHDQRDMGCQCNLQVPVDAEYAEYESPLETAAGLSRWDTALLDKPGSYSENWHRVSSNQGNHGNYGNQCTQNDQDPEDEEGVEKVHYWLQSNYSSESDLDILPHCVTDPYTEVGGDCSFKRQPSIRIKRPRRSDFPGNWKLVPKSLEQFPSRFPAHECHQTNCDRCDVRNRPENARSRRREIILQNVTADDPVPSTSHAAVSTVYDTKSQSSDSAIGGSGERLWNNKHRRIPLSPADGEDEAELLQDLIQPDDSASGVVVMEPYPDYSVVDEKFRTQKSYKTELSRVLRDFECDLKLF